MTSKEARCPICGTKNDADAESCKMCKTVLSKKEGGKTKVKAPKGRGRTITIVDIEDPLTRKRLEELTLIPGVDRRKALLLYQSGITSMEEFLQKAFHGEKLSVNFARTVGNKLLVRSMKGKKKKAEILCPSCDAPNPIEAERCKVCSFDIKADMDAISISSLAGQMDEAVSGIMADLSKSEEFDALPEEMKRELAIAAGTEDVDIDMAKPDSVDSLGIDLDKVEEERAQEKSVPETHVEESKPEPEKSQGPIAEAEPASLKAEPAPPEPAPPKAADRANEATNNEGQKSTADQPASARGDPKKEKVRKVLTEKLTQWRKAGYDVAPLEDQLEDVEAFKAKAKEVLAQGKVIKNRCAKQLDMWREKGFDVSELEPLLETDVPEFMEKAKEVLKRQKKH